MGEFYTDKSKYLDLIKEEHRKHYVIMDRFVSKKEADEVFQLSDTLVLPYKTASQSGVFNDALNFLLPAVVANHPGLTEHITHLDNGLIFESENVNELAEILKKISTDDALRQKISSNLNNLKAQLSWERFSTKLMEMVEIKT